jgi:fibronectin-binding autotransporter adhesin
VRNAWVVASELATGRGKDGSTKVATSRPATAREHEGRVSTRAWPLRMAVLATLLALQAPARAADRYWDVNETSLGQGGTGLWDLTNPLWSASADGVSGPYSLWNNAALDDVFFGGTAGTVTLGAPITAHNLTFSVSGYTLTGNTLTLGGVAPTVTMTGNGTINSIVAGTAGLTKAGAGELFLTGNNTFSGGITLTGGTLGADDDLALGNLTNNISVTNSSTLRIDSGSTNRAVAIGSGATLTLRGVGTGSALYGGSGNLSVGVGITLSNDNNTYTGTTSFTGCNGICTTSFTSVRNLGEASSLGAPTTVANGTITFNSVANYSDDLAYIGDGDTSNRNWSIGGSRTSRIHNLGSGTLTLTGNIATSGATLFAADSADLHLEGVISGTAALGFQSGLGRTIVLGGANSYTGATNISAGTTRAPVLADVGLNSSFGTGSAAPGGLMTIGAAVLSYTGTGASTNRAWDINTGTISNDGSGALTLTGNVNLLSHLTLGGSYTGSDNTVSGVISGTGNLISNGPGTWVLSGANTRSGAITVQNGTLRAANAQAFGTTTGITINAGTLDLNGFDLQSSSLAGSGGTLALGSATLTLNAATGTTNYAGNISGSGGLTKLGVSTQTLSGANTYTGATTVGGGTLGLNFAAAGGPTSNIISSLSTLNMAGGTLTLTGAAGESNTQTFNGVNVTGGTNNIGATSGTGGSVTLNLGAINRTGGLVDFDLPTNGFITTSNASLGGWATINNGANYAKVVGGNITALAASDYTVQNNPSLWQDNQIITDSATGFTTSAVDSPDGTLQLGGLRYTAARATTVNIASGDTLGIDGNILVAPTVGNFNQTITGGSLTGPLGGGMLGIQQNAGGTFTIASQIVDNGAGTVGFTKAGTGTVALTNTSNTYSGPTVVSQGTLQVGHIANGGQASSIGDSSAASSNLVIESATLSYTGAGDTTDRGFTISRGGPGASEVNVANAAANLTFTGQVTSADDADFKKSGAGTLTLTNGTNDYVGVTTVSGGTLSVTTLANGGAVSSIGRSSSSSANLVLSGGGTLQYTANDATVSSDRGFTLGTGGGGIDVSDADTTLTLSGTAVGAGALRKSGAGTLVLSGTNAYTGATTIDGGTLRAGSENAFGGPALMTLANTAGVTLDLAGFDNTIAALSGGGANGGNVLLGGATLTLQNANGTYSGAISGSGGVLKQGSGTQTMVGCNHSYTGATTILGGTLSVNCLADGGQASGIGASSGAPGNLVIGGTLNYTGSSVSIDRGFQAASGTVSVSAGTTLEFEGQVTGSQFTKSGDGTLVLSGTGNNYGGATFVSGGTLRAGATNAFGVSGIRMDVAGATLDLDGFNTTVAYLSEASSTANRNITLDGATLTINAGGGTYSGVISGAGSLIKSVGGTQALTGCNNSYTGSTRITAGGLTVSCLSDGGSNSSIGNSSAAASSLYINGTLGYVGAGSTTNRQFTVGTGGATLDASGTGAVSFTSTAAITLEGTTARTLTLRGTNTDNNTLAAQITNSSVGTTRLTKLDDGTWVLTNPNNTYTGITTISGGVLSVSKLADGGQASSIGASSNAATNLSIGNESTLRYTGTGDTTDRRFTLAPGVTFIESSGSGAIQFTNTGNVTLSGTAVRTIALGGTNTGLNIMGGTIADASASGKTTLAKNDSGTWVLTGNNTYTGHTVINDGNLIIGNGGTTGNTGAGNVIVDSATSTLSINRSDAFDFNGTLSGPGALAQIGTGTTRLTSASNSIGATTVSAGTLEVDGSLSSATIAMNGASTLNVDGTVQGAGGTPATFTGDAGSSTVNVRTGGTLLAGGNLGGGSDTLNVTGTLNTGASALSLGAGDDTFTLNDGAAIAGGGVDAGTATSADTLQVNNAASLSFSGTNVSGFERLIKQNTGVLTMTGTQSFSAGTQVTAGTLDVDGTLDTSSVALADGTTLNVDGTLQSAGGTPAAITGSAGTNTVLVNTGATLSASGDLGGGSDTVTLAGTLNTGSSSLGLGAGDDTLTLNDGASISGAGIDAGTAASNDVLVLNNALALMFNGGSTSGFENLTKQNSGTASMTGSQSFGAGTTISGGTLDIDGTLQTPTLAMADGTTLNVDGSVQAAGGTQATITGSTGVNTLFVNTGATLLADGNLGDGSDVVTLGGTLNSGAGALSLGAGDDRLTLNDGAVLSGTGIDAAAGANDQLILNNANALTFNAAATTAFEALIKQNAGIAAMTGTQTFSAGTTISGGTLSVAGTLQTPTVSLADGTTLDVDGVVQAAGATQSALTGSAGTNTVTVAAGGTLRATGDLGNGSDVLDVAGTFDTGAGALSLGDGDDSFLVHDGTNVVGTVDGGAGLDTRVYNISLNADVGALLGFEGLTKTGTGVLSINGPGTTNLAEIEVLGGTLDVAAGGAVTGVTSTNVASGATLNVDGAYDGSAGSDTFTVAGTVGGSGNIDLGDGDDTLTLQDGAAVNAAVSGGAVGTDSVVLDNANALTFDGANVADFEDLTKQNSGAATLTGVHNYDSTAIDGGVLDVDGTLNAGSITLADGTALNVDGTVQGAGATPTTITGTTGVNTIVVNDGGSLLASGDLGDGNDVLDVAGTLDTGGGTFSLGAGDDTFVVRNTTAVIGTLDAGAGNDLLNVNVDAGNLVPLGSTTGFESLGKSGLGALEINGASDFVDVQVQAGLLDITAGGSIEAQTASVSSGATLNVDGALAFTAGADDFTVGGAVTGAGTIDMLDGDDQLTILDGADLSGLATSLDGGTGNDTLTANIATSATLGGVTGFEALTKDGAGTLNVAGPASSSFSTVLVQDGLLDVAAAANVTDVSSTTVASGATLNVDGAYAGSAGSDTFTVAGTVNGGGSIDLGGGDDVLTIQEGAALNTVIDAGADVAGDRVVIDNTSALTFDSTDVSGFEQLEKQNTGTVSLTGTHVYDSATLSGGTLDVDGTLETATATLADGTRLNIDGSMQGAGGTQAAITGSTGVNTVTVSAGATLLATGDLGDGSDVLDVGGTLDAGAGNFNLGAGDDTFVVHDGTNVVGTIVGGAGLDTRAYNIAGVANVGALQEFEGLTKQNTGTLNINGPGTTDVLEVAVEGGTLNIAAAGDVTGVQTTTVNAGATLNVEGTYAGSTSNDTFTVAGTVSGAGSIDLGDGDDTLTLQDGAAVNAAIAGGNAVNADRVVLDNASDFSFDGANVAGFEALVKQNTGTATLVGTHTYDSTAIDGGTLAVDGTLETATVTLADGATLQIDGTVQAAGGTQTAITGTTGVNSVVVNAGSALLATGDLGDGNDVLDVAGTFDIGAGTFALGAGDDTFVVHDNTTITGAIDGGAGLDTRVYDINATATLGALTNFEGLTKTGTGMLNIQGPGSSNLAEVDVLGGTLNVAAGGGIVGITNASIGAGATLNVDGAFDFTAGGDTFNVAGTITGLTSVNMLDGDDELTLSDGADLSGLASPLDGGTGNDLLVANISTTATLGGVSSFENLTKQGAGSLNVVANSTFDTVLVDGGRLDVASGATVEANTAMVSAGATLNVDGDFLFTAGGDTFTVAGNVTGAGAIEMLDGDDQLTLRDGADLSGLASSLDGGDGADTLTADIATQATLGGATGFETLIKEGAGLVTIAGPADSMFETVLVREGELNVAAGALVDPQTTAVDASATMTIDGTYQGTADADTFTLSGTLAGSGAVDLLDGDDVLTVNTGADVAFTGVFDANAASADRFVLAGTGQDSFDANLIGTVFQNFDAFRKEGAGTWRLTGTGSNDWTVAEGTLIGDTRSFGGDIDNAATVIFDQASDGTYDHVLSGNGTLIKQNTGTLVMTGTNAFAGNTQIEAGTLQIEGTLPGALTVGSGGTLSGVGTVGNVTNLTGGLVAPGTAALPFGTLTITGDYAGGGTVRINTVLGNETSDTGRLLIQGNANGTSTVLINRWSGDGARTQGDGIEIVQVDGTSASDNFRLGQSVQAGAYQYLLYQGGSSDANDWYLRSELIDPNNPPDDEEPTPAFRLGVPGYVLGHQANLEYGFTALGNLRARIGDKGRAPDAEQHAPADAWMRVYTDELDVAGNRFAAEDLQMTNVQFGTDLYTHASGKASTHFGMMASVGESRATLFDTARASAGLSTLAGEMQTDAKGVGMYWTHFGTNGGYFDLAAQALHYINRYRDQTLTDADQTGWGGTLSAELGAVYALGADWMIEPQLQLAYQRLELDAFEDQISRVAAMNDDGLRARVGMQLLRAPSDWLGMHGASPYVGVGAQRDLREASAVTVGGTTINDEIPDTTGDVNVGFTGSVFSGVELHLDVRYQKSTEGEKDGVRANFGFRMSF